MTSISWFLLAWLAVSLVVSVVLGQLLRHNSAAVDQEADDVVNRKKVVRYLRQHKIVKYENHTDRVPSTPTAKSKSGNGQ